MIAHASRQRTDDDHDNNDVDDDDVNNNDVCAEESIHFFYRFSIYFDTVFISIL